VLDREELKLFLEESGGEKLTDDELQDALGFFDQNSDQQINLDEFVNWILLNQSEKSNTQYWIKIQ
jgi:Ca2+-binding EF-hand superfamily protein